MIKDKSLLKASVFTVTLALTILSGCSSGGDGDSNEANSDIISDGPRDNSNDEAPDDGVTILTTTAMKQLMTATIPTTAAATTVLTTTATM